LLWPPLMLIPYGAWQHEWFVSSTAAMTLKDEILALLSVKICIALVSSVFLIEKTRAYYKTCCVRCGCPITYTRSLPFGKGMRDRCIAYSLCLLVDVLTTSLAIGLAVLQAMANEMADPNPNGSFALRDNVDSSGEARATGATGTTLPAVMHMRPTDAVRKDDAEFYDWVNTILTMPSVHTKVCVSTEAFCTGIFLVLLLHPTLPPYMLNPCVFLLHWFDMYGLLHGFDIYIGISLCKVVPVTSSSFFFLNDSWQKRLFTLPA
jgi:hypothetical protein